MSIENILGHDFHDASLLQEALTHPSCAEIRDGAPFNYQRLEFLGDAVLGMVVAELLLALYPQENEGGLAKRQAALVRSESLAGVARRLGLGPFMRLNPGDQESARDLSSNLEDVCEALIGALYLDGGFEAAHAFVRKHWEPLARAVSAAPKDAKTALQEWAQGRGLDLPEYTVLEMSGPAHAPQFTVSARVQGHAPETALAASKRQAEQLAAKALLMRLEKL